MLFPVLRRGLFTFPPPAVASGSLLDCGPPSGINSQPRVTTPNAAAAGGGEIGAEGPDQGGLRRITPCGEQGVAAFVNPATLALGQQVGPGTQRGSSKSLLLPPRLLPSHLAPSSGTLRQNSVFWVGWGSHGKASVRGGWCVLGRVAREARRSGDSSGTDGKGQDRSCPQTPQKKNK